MNSLALAVDHERAMRRLTTGRAYVAMKRSMGRQYAKAKAKRKRGKRLTPQANAVRERKVGKLAPWNAMDEEMRLYVSSSVAQMIWGTEER